MAVPAKVIQLMDKSGAKGVRRVRCKIVLENSRHERTILRNVMGPVRLGDILMISESEMEAASVIE